MARLAVLGLFSLLTFHFIGQPIFEGYYSLQGPPLNSYLDCQVNVTCCFKTAFISKNNDKFNFFKIKPTTRHDWLRC